MAIQEAYVQGISARSVDDLVGARNMTGISNSQGSRLCEEIDDKIQTFVGPLVEGRLHWNRRPWIDPTYVKVQEK